MPLPAGTPTSVILSSPAVGTDVVLTVQAGQVWSVRALRFLLTASAQVATRIPHLMIDDGANIVFQYSPASIQGTLVASSTAFIVGATTVGQDQALTGFSGATVQQFQLPDLVMPANWRIRTQTVAIQTGDQWSQLALAVVVG